MTSGSHLSPSIIWGSRDNTQVTKIGDKFSTRPVITSIQEYSLISQTLLHHFILKLNKL